MHLSDIIHASRPPVPWQEGDKIPWNEPGFSRRMLREHLSQQHDAASRRQTIIDSQVDWIDQTLLGGQPGKVLDLGCGPGFYLNRLARLGHRGRGIDFSPASVDYARREAEGLPVEYVLSDLREAVFGDGYDLVMFLFGEFNVFRPEHAELILKRAFAALKPGGRLLLEPSPYEHIKFLGEEPDGWYPSRGGLFSERPHLCLEEHFWDPEAAVATTRYFIADAATGEVTRYASSSAAYTDDQFRALLERTGFAEIRFWPGLGEHVQPDMFALGARKPNP